LIIFISDVLLSGEIVTVVGVTGTGGSGVGSSSTGFEQAVNVSAIIALKKIEKFFMT